MLGILGALLGGAGLYIDSVRNSVNDKDSRVRAKRQKADIYYDHKGVQRYSENGRRVLQLTENGDEVLMDASNGTIYKNYSEEKRNEMDKWREEKLKELNKELEQRNKDLLKWGLGIREEWQLVECRGKTDSIKDRYKEMRILTFRIKDNLEVFCLNRDTRLLGSFHKSPYGEKPPRINTIFSSRVNGGISCAIDVDRLEFSAFVEKDKYLACCFLYTEIMTNWREIFKIDYLEEMPEWFQRSEKREGKPGQRILPPLPKTSVKAYEHAKKIGAWLDLEEVYKEYGIQDGIPEIKFFEMQRDKAFKGYKGATRMYEKVFDEGALDNIDAMMPEEMSEYIHEADKKMCRYYEALGFVRVFDTAEEYKRAKLTTSLNNLKFPLGDPENLQQILFIVDRFVEFHTLLKRKRDVLKQARIREMNREANYETNEGGQ